MHLRLRHFAQLVSEEGHVLPLCGEPAAITTLPKTMWTSSPKSVTCGKCWSKLLEQADS